MVFKELSSWCKKNSILCFVALVVVLHVTGLLNNILQCLGLESFAPYPSSVDNQVNTNMDQGIPVQPQKKPQLQAGDLLPTDQAKAIQEFNIAKPIGEGILEDINSLKAGYHIGVDTVGQTLRNANRQVRSEPPNPQVNVSPWMNTTIAYDNMRKPLEIGENITSAP